MTAPLSYTRAEEASIKLYSDSEPPKGMDSVNRFLSINNRGLELRVQRCQGTFFWHFTPVASRQASICTRPSLPIRSQISKTTDNLTGDTL